MIYLKFFRRCAAALLAAVLGTSMLTCVPAAALDTMPVPFGTATQNSAYFAKPCDDRLSLLPEALMNLAEGGNSWEYSYAEGKPEWALTLMDYANVYSFIHDHDLDPDAVRSALSDGERMVHRIPFTDEEIDILLGDDAALAMQRFASGSTIVIGDKGYCAKWMYYHTPEEYAAEGITPEMVAAVLPYYYDPLYVQEAADAFSEKLYDYTSVLAPTKCKQWCAGDTNLDGMVSVMDMVLMQRYLLGQIPMDFRQWASADLDGDGQADIYDLSLLKQRVLNGTIEQPLIPLDVIEYCQYPDYPTGCESVSLFMLLRYYGVDVTVDQIYDLLPMGPQPYWENGVKYGANPETEFVGDPRSSSSFGVFNRPVAQVAELFKPGAQTKEQATLDDIHAIIDSGNPVLAWYVTAPMRSIVYRRSWQDYQSDAIVHWPGGEHAIVICGYDEDTIVYRDPNAGTTVTVDNDIFLKSFHELGGRIVYYTDAPA